MGASSEGQVAAPPRGQIRSACGGRVQYPAKAAVTLGDMVVFIKMAPGVSRRRPFSSGHDLDHEDVGSADHDPAVPFTGSDDPHPLQDVVSGCIPRPIVRSASGLKPGCPDRREVLPARLRRRSVRRACPSRRGAGGTYGCGRSRAFLILPPTA